MLKKLSYGLPVLFLAACAESPEKYRDTHHLELPPVLRIEHTNPQPALAVDDMKPKSSLASLMDFAEVGGKPRLTLKTSTDRAWEMIATALKISDVAVLDKNQDENRFQVRYDPDTGGKDVSLIRELLNNHYPEAEYTIRLKDEISGVVVNAALSKPDSEEPDADGSDELIRLLHKLIDEKIINRAPGGKAEE